MPAGRQLSAAEPSLTRLRGAISRACIETILTRAAAAFALLFAVQTIPAVSASSAYLHPWFAILTAASLFGLLFIVLVAAAFNRRGNVPAHVAMSVFTVDYVVLLALWPAGLRLGANSLADQPWLWYLIAIAMIFASVTYPMGWAIFYEVFVTGVYVFIRFQPAGGAAEAGLPLLDGFYVLLLGAFALAIITALRRAAEVVDGAQATAMKQYALAAGNHAAELERTKVDALVHDTVLSTLIAAARAETDADRSAVVAMSTTALATLQEAPVAFDPAVDVSLAQLSARLAEAAQLLSPRIIVASARVSGGWVPGPVAEAVFTAAQQALINSLQHAGDAEEDVLRTLLVASDGPAGFTVQVADTGRGFDLHRVPRARLGLRVSIVERVESEGGRVRVCSVPGGGTSVVIEWEPGS